MKRASLQERAFRTLMLVYPRSFRARFGSELLQVFRTQVEQRHTRVRHRTLGQLWFFTITDLARSGVHQRVEAVMSRFSPGSRTAVVAVLAATALITVALVATQVPLTLPIVAIGLCWFVISRRRDLPEAMRQSIPWYAVMASGVGVFALLALGDALVPDVNGAPADLLWFVALGAFVFGGLLIVAGAVLGIAAGVRRLRPAQ